MCQPLFTSKRSEKDDQIIGRNAQLRVLKRGESWNTGEGKKQPSVNHCLLVYTDLFDFLSGDVVTNGQLLSVAT